MSAGSDQHAAAAPMRFSTRIALRRRRRQRAGWTMVLNLTPMIDIVFNLLFFFLVATRFGAIEGLLPAKLPAQTTAVPTAEVPRIPIKIRIHPTPPGAAALVSIDRFQETAIPIAELLARLETIRRDEPGFDATAPVHLIADDDIEWGHVVNAFNAALAAGYEKIYFAGGS